MLLSHVTVGVNDLERSIRFYDSVLAPLGYTRFKRGQTWAGYGEYGDVGIGTFWILLPANGEPASVGNGTNFAFLASSRNAVDQFHAQGLESGGQDEGKPGIRAQNHPNFYAAYLRDPDGHKCLAVYHGDT